MLKYVYRLSDGLFLVGGPCEPAYNHDTEGVVTVARHPNRRTERYDSQTLGWIREATAQEIAAADALDRDEGARKQLDGNKDVMAAVAWIAQRLNVPIATARQEILAIRRGL